MIDLFLSGQLREHGGATMELLKLGLVGSISGVVVAYLLRVWVESRVRGAIEYQYNQKLERLRRDINYQEKAELVSELLAIWIKVPAEESMSREHRTMLNHLSFKATIWLPSELAIQLSKTIQTKPGAKNIFQILLHAREAIIGDTSLAPEHVTYWDHTHEQPKPTSPPNIPATP